MVGICGAGMRALAEWLTDRGCRVTGSDAAPNDRAQRSLASLGITVRRSDAQQSLPNDCEQLIYSAAVPADNPERVAARSHAVPQASFPQMLGELTRQKRSVCVAGTHGKSTTTALIAALLQSVGRHPDVICGAEMNGFERSGWAGNGDWLVAEACEFRRHFLHLTPHTLVVTGIEWDHVDCYRSLSETIDAFAALMRRVPAEGCLILNGDCAATRKSLAIAGLDHAKRGPRVVLCGVDAANDWKLAARVQLTKSTVVEVRGPDRRILRFTLPMLGGHNTMNAVIAGACCHELGVDDRQIPDVSQFGGVKRRLEYISDWRGMTLYDDYAHHPTAVLAVLAALRQVHPGRRLLAVFEPHQVRRTNQFRGAFAEALRGADRSWVLPVYAARENVEAATVEASTRLAKAARLSGMDTSCLESLDHVLPTLETEGRPGDVVVLMGAGKIERIADEFTFGFRRHHAG